MELTRARYSVQKNKPQRKRWWKVFVAVFLVILLFSSGGFSYAALQKPLPPLTTTAEALAPVKGKNISLPWPNQGQAALGSLEEGVLASSSEKEQTKPIASMTKVITALAIMKKTPFLVGEEGKTFTITQADVTSYNNYVAKSGSVVPVKVGQKITQYQALQALLLASSNNMADSLVVWTFGSMDAYLTYANQMIDTYELKSLTVRDASGFSPKSVSTPSDLIVIAQAALSQPVLKSIVAQHQATIPGIGTIRNTNRLLSTEGVIGIKTGTTDEAGNCLLFAAEHKTDDAHSTTIIGVVMGAQNSSTVFQNATNLLAAAKKGFGMIEILPAGINVGKITSAWGDSTNVVTTEDMKVYGWKGKDYTITTLWHEEDSVLESNTEVGQIGLAEKLTVTVKLQTNSAIGSPSNLWRLQNYL